MSFGAALEKVENGIKLTQVFNNTTANEAGLKAGDVLTKINQKEIKNIPQLVDKIKLWKVYDTLEFTFIRNKKTCSVSGLAKSIPKETCKYGTTIYGEVPFDGGYLRSILTMPSSVKNPPVIFFMQGVGCASIDFYNNESSIVKLLIDELVAQGIAVYRIEKPGMGDSNNKTHCLEMDYDLEFEAFNEGLKTLKSLKSAKGNILFPDSKIVLFGESLSSMTAPYLALKHKIKGIINWGGIAGTWFDYYMSLQINQKQLFGVNQEDIEKNYKKLKPFYTDYLVNNLTPAQLKQKGYSELVDKYFRADSTWAGLHHYKYFQVLNKRNSLDAYAKVNCMVLSLAGKHDIHTANTQWAIDITNAVNKLNRGNASYELLPNTTHHYYKVPSIKEYNKLRRANKINTSYMKANFDNDIPKIIANWIKSVQ